MKAFEKFILSSKWFLLPLYVGLILSLSLFIVKFFVEIVHLFTTVHIAAETDLILGVLSLIDMVLVANLLFMVIISGYQSFIMPFSSKTAEDTPEWLGKLNPNLVKVKVATSIIGISSIHLLSAFLNVHRYSSEQMFWLVTIHLTFIISAWFMAYLNKKFDDKKQEAS